MKIVTAGWFLGALALGGSLVASAAPQSTAPIAVETKDGESSRVVVLGVADGRARLKVSVFGGEATLSRSLDEYTPDSAFRIELAAADPKTFDQHFALARRAAELGLLPQAGTQARAAIKASAADADADAKKKKLHAWAADALEKMLADALADGDLKEAESCLELLTSRLPEQRSEEQLAKLADSIDALRDRETAKQASAQEAKLEAQKAGEQKKALDPIRKRSAAGDKLLSKAFAQSNSTAASARSCESAVDEYKAAWLLAQELLKTRADDEALQAALAPMADHIADSGVRAALHAARVLTLQTDYKGATDWVNRVLKFDPENGEAKAMAMTIAEASAASAADRNDYRYTWTGRPRSIMRRR